MIKTIFLLIGLLQTPMAQASLETTESLKQQIFRMAQSFEGQADPGQSKQRELEKLVKKLVAQTPMPPIKERIPLLEGAWKQIWGPYDYRNDDGGIDPKIGIYEIYQVVSANGYYYNVAPYYPNERKDREQIGLLRGEYKLDSSNPNGLRVKFTNYPGVEPRPAKMQIWELADLAEAGELENEITIVPTWIVRLFFGGGTLDEVYTDRDMRILYGQGAKKNARRFLYVMQRME
jgi:hypothetical protein